MGKKRASKRDILSLIGKLNWACKVVFGGRTFLRRLINLTMPLKANHHRTWISKDARDDIVWWDLGLSEFHGFSPFICDLKPPDTEVVTDACLVGGGGFHNSDWFYTNFETDFPGWKNSPINALELLTVLVAVRRWGPLWAGKHIRIKCDNSATVQAINKGSSRSPLFMCCIREMFWLSVRFGFRLTAVHIPGDWNYLADLISRLHVLDCVNKFLRICGVKNLNCFYNMSFSAFLRLQGLTHG